MSGFTPRSHVRSEGCTVVVDYVPSLPTAKDARLHAAAPEMYELLRASYQQRGWTGQQIMAVRALLSRIDGKE